MKKNKYRGYIMPSSKLVAQTTAQVVIFFIIFALFIFLPAGTINFWQGWAFFAVFCVSTVIITAYFLIKDPALISRRIKTGETRKQQQVFQAISGMVFLSACL